MSANSEAVVSDPSFIYFIYPFLFEAQQFEHLSESLEKVQLPGRKQPFEVWKRQAFPEDDLLFHVANYLNPTSNRLPTARLWKFNEALRDTFGFREEWELVCPKGVCPQGAIPFCFGKEGEGSQVAQLALFKVGVGFLTLQVQPRSKQISDWLNFLHYFRFLKGQQGTGVKALGCTGLDEDTKQSILELYFPEIAGGTSQYKQGKGCFGELVKALLNTAVLQAQSPENLASVTPWWSEVFVQGQMLPFVALFIENLPEDKTPYLLYKLQNFFHVLQGSNPAPENLQLNSPAFLPYAERQWFFFSLEGGGFVAADAPPTDFFQQTLPNHLRVQYFLLFLLALHQRFALMMLSAKVAQNWLVSEGRQADRQHQQVFEDIRNQLLLFIARGYFTQVMQRDHHHRCYRQWHEVFQVERLYQEVSEEVREMHEYTLAEQTSRLEKTIQIVGVAAGTGGIVAGSISAYIKEPLTFKPTWDANTLHPAVFSLLLSVILGIFAGGITWLYTGGFNWIVNGIKHYSQQKKS